MMDESRSSFESQGSIVRSCCRSSQELAFSFSIFVLGKLVPFLFNSWYTWESPIPYQQTDSGDVLLELDLNHEFETSETVPDWLAVLLCILLPMLLFVIVGCKFGPPGDVHASLCFFFITLGLSWFLTDIMKIYTGQLRPNFYEMCNYNKNTRQCESNNPHLLTESRRSFPSGHASLAFASMTTLFLYFLGKVGIQRNVHSKRITLLTRLLYLLSFAPLLLAFFIAASRVHDFWHHPADVVAGSLIGVACSLCVHGMW